VIRGIAMALELVVLITATACSRNSLPPIVAPQRVFVIVMENHSFDGALQGAYTATLAKQAGVATNYHAIAHPSVPNYLAITSGQTWGINEDVYQALPPQDLGDQLTSARVSWRAYMEGLGDGGCSDSPPPYDRDHNPFAYYGGRCPATWFRSATWPTTSTRRRPALRGSRPMSATTSTTARPPSATTGCVRPSA
jgi:phosphoesterase family protein